MANAKFTRGRARPTPRLLNTLAGVLDDGTLTQVSMAVIVGLVCVIQHGVEFV